MRTQLRSGRRGQRHLGWLVAFAATVIVAPGYAVTIPAVPLQSGSAYPPANIRFILDDSGSMSFDSMPDRITSTSPVDVSLGTYALNTLYYNPDITYQAWRKADGSRYSGGTSYDAVYASFNLVGGTTVNLGDSSSCGRFNTNDNATTDEGLGTWVCGGVRSFYVPKDGATDLTATASFWRYTIQSSGSDIVRSEYGAVAKTNVVPVTVTPNAGTVNNSTSTHVLGSVAANLSLDIVIASTNNRAADYVVKGPGNVSICSGSVSNKTDTCTVTTTAAGVYSIVMSRNSSKDATYTLSASTYRFNSCDGSTSGNGWINCTSATPVVHNADKTTSQRSLADELKNYSTWYSYHRTRIKTAKAGASEAFFNMGSNVRVGFDTIWHRNEFAIPVGTNNGVFTDTNRSTWYSRLQGAIAYNGTPLKGALQRAGVAFSDTSASGPWGPETGTNQLSCRQNFSILTTDGYWNDDSGYSSPVGDADNTAGPTNTPAKGATWTYTPAKPFIDNFKSTPGTRADTLADIAMYYWKRDLVSTLANNVPKSTADPAFWQHMVTFGVSIGQQGTLTPNSATLDSIINGTQNWPDPIPTENATRIDDLWHASVNGHGSFVTASSPTEFARGLLDALKTVGERTGSASNVTANSTSFVGNTYVYQASYVSGKWTGELSAYSASASGVAATAFWKAASQVSPTGRKVYTWSGSAGTTFPTAGQVTALDQSSRLLSPVNGSDNASYIKGVATKERRFNGGVLRDRDSLLGDIVNSSPMYVAETDTIFVGANDGMLHAFNGSTGAELFGYVPGGVNLADLASLSDPQYTHKYFVDGPVVVSTKAQTSGINYLVGALGNGGKGVFTLDVTNAASFGTSNVKWESAANLSAAQKQDMGYVLGEPLIVTLNDASRTKAVIVSNGINSDNGHAVLFVFNLATGALMQPPLDTGVGGDNGLSAPRGWDDNGDGTVDYVYAGDRKGNLWKFDFTGTTASIGVGGNPLFKTASGQPITTGLALAKDPLSGKRWVFIGTGSFLSNGDVSDNTVQSMYGVIDDGTATVSLGRSDLTARNITVSTTVNGKAVRGFEPSGTLDSAKKGWYIDLNNPTNGERIVSRPQVKGGVLITASLIPPTNDSCEAGGSGYINAVDAFSGASLHAPFFDSNGDGKVDASDQLTYTADGTTNTVPVGSIDLGVGMPTLPTVIDKLLVVGGSTGALGSVTINPQGGAAQRVSWREILRD